MIDSAFAPTSSGVGTDYSSASVPISSLPGVVPPAPPSIPPAYSNPTPPAKKKSSGSFFKLFGLGVVLVVLIGGLITAYVLSQQEQEIRQQASQADNYTQNPFTFQDSNNNLELVFTREGSSGPTEVKGTFTYPSNPSCNANSSCNATAQFNISEINSTGDTDYICTTNTANLVYYKFLTNTNDPNYPGNLTHNTPTVNANCNRPLSQCDNDPSCTRSEIIRLYGPSGCGDQCRQFVTSIDFNITNTEYGCGCVQFDPNISELSLNCRMRDETENTTYTFTRGTSSGPWAYAYNTAQCSTPVSPSPTATISPTPASPTNTPTQTPTVPPGLPSKTPTPTLPPGVPSATPTPTSPPFGGMCLSISMSPATPAYNDSVTFTCGLVQGVAKYEFRYFEPGVLTPIKLDASSGNVSKAIKVTKAGTYTAQCRICPIATASNLYCNDPNWGWDPTITTQSR